MRGLFSKLILTTYKNKGETSRSAVLRSEMCSQFDRPRTRRMPNGRIKVKLRTEVPRGFPPQVKEKEPKLRLKKVTVGVNLGVVKAEGTWDKNESEQQ